jgi:hypothetical protein
MPADSGGRVSVKSFLLRMRWANEQCGVDLLRDNIAAKERELAEMYATLARHEPKAERYLRSYQAAREEG